VLFAQHITKNREEAEDIVQDAFSKIWQMREQIAPEQLLEGFVYTSVKNTALNFLTRQRTHARYHSEQVYLQEDGTLSADAGMLVAETELLIQNLINGMPPQRRMVYQLSRNEGLTYEQIAEQMGIAYGTVHSHMKTALREVRTVVSSLVLLLILLK
jgi:RNA polymerase sigma-70 factor (ECF subfamily)